jgi:hypothetical protein
MVKDWHSMLRKGGAAFILLLLLVTPIFNWRLGAFFWLWAMLFYVIQGLFGRGRRGAGTNGPESGAGDEEDGNS